MQITLGWTVAMAASTKDYHGASLLGVFTVVVDVLFTSFCTVFYFGS